VAIKLNNLGVSDSKISGIISKVASYAEAPDCVIKLLSRSALA
jgi:hypothetical protein